MGATKKSNPSHSPYRVGFSVKHHVSQCTKPMFTVAGVLIIFTVIHTLNRLHSMGLLKKTRISFLKQNNFLLVLTRFLFLMYAIKGGKIT